MRIIGGRAKSIAIKTLPLGDIRPATDFTRERLFGYLGEACVQGARVLDSFAGFGSYGLEALSRGAVSATFVDQNPQALACIEDTHKRLSRSLGETLPIQVLRHNVLAWTPPEHAFDLIFADPPYDAHKDLFEGLLPLLKGALAQGPQARLVLELPSRKDPPQETGLGLLRHFTSKKTHAPALAIYELTAQT